MIKVAVQYQNTLFESGAMDGDRDQVTDALTQVLAGRTPYFAMAVEGAHILFPRAVLREAVIRVTSVEPAAKPAPEPPAPQFVHCPSCGHESMYKATADVVAQWACDVCAAQQLEREAWALYVDANDNNPHRAISWAYLSQAARDKYMDKAKAANY